MVFLSSLLAFQGTPRGAPTTRPPRPTSRRWPKGYGSNGRRWAWMSSPARRAPSRRGFAARANMQMAQALSRRGGGARHDAGAGAQDHGAARLVIQAARVVAGPVPRWGQRHGHRAGHEGHDRPPRTNAGRLPSTVGLKYRLHRARARRAAVVALMNPYRAAHRMPAKKTTTEPPLELRDACIVAAQEVDRRTRHREPELARVVAQAGCVPPGALQALP